MRKLLVVIAVVMGLVVPWVVGAEQYTTFSKGSNKSLVLVLQGKPDTITKHHTYEMWHYDYNSVTISLKDGKVIKWHNTNGRLKVPKEKRVEKKTVAKNKRGKRKDDRGVKSISLGVVGVSSAHTRDNAPPMDYELYCPVFYNGYREPAYNNYREPAYSYYEEPAYDDYVLPAYNNYSARSGLWEDEGAQPQVPDRQPTFVNGGMDNRGNFYYPSGGGGGATWRSDGTFMINTGGGFIDVNNGKFIPGQ